MSNSKTKLHLETNKKKKKTLIKIKNVSKSENKTFRMSYLFVGSSNVSRFYKRQNFKDNKSYFVQKSTQIKGFELFMSEVEADFIVISVIENFLVDAAGENLEHGQDMIDKTISDFGAIMRAAATRLPSTKFAVILPLKRPAIEWYQERFEVIKKKYVGMIDAIGLVNVGKVETSLSSSQHFESDGVHLTQDSGMNFISIVLESAERFFEAVAIDLTEGSEGNDSTEASVEQNKMEKRIEKLEADMREIKKQKIKNDIVFARLREDVDYERNRQKEDRVVINHLKVTDVPADHKSKMDHYKHLAAEVFEYLIPDFTGKVMWIQAGRNPENGESLPMLEVRLDNVKAASDIRKAFAKKSREGLTNKFEKIFITNCITKSTRVRVEIMKAIARKLTREGEMAYVAGFIPRPVLHIKKVVEGKRTFPYKTFTFVDCVTRFGNLVMDSDLTYAYNQALPFDGELEQNFIILNEKGLRARPINRERGNVTAGRSWRGGRGGRGAQGGRGGYGGRGGRGQGWGANITPLGDTRAVSTPTKRLLDENQDKDGGKSSSKMRKKE